MELAKIEVRGTCAKVIYSRDIPKGIVGATITIKYLDPMWDNLVKTVVFRGCVTRDVIDDGEVVTIPHEVVERSSTPLIVGISGADADNNLVIPTFWADLGIVQDAADPSGDPSADPSLPIWAVLRAELDRLKNSGATDEQIAAAVAAYLEENPVGTGTVRTVNDTEPDENGNVSINIPADYVKTVNGTAPDKNGNVEITIPDSGGNVDWLDPEEGEVFTAIVSTPDEPDEPDVPEVTLTSLSATYTGGNVAVGTAVTALTGITVTAHYSDGSTEPVTGYTLSGEIVEGSNTITVSYGGKTTTFTVTGEAQEAPEQEQIGQEGRAVIGDDGYIYLDVMTIPSTEGPLSFINRTVESSGFATFCWYCLPMVADSPSESLFKDTFTYLGTSYNGIRNGTVLPEVQYGYGYDGDAVMIRIPYGDYESVGASIANLTAAIASHCRYLPIKMKDEYNTYSITEEAIDAATHYTLPSLKDNGFYEGWLYISNGGQNTSGVKYLCNHGGLCGGLFENYSCNGDAAPLQRLYVCVPEGAIADATTLDGWKAFLKSRLPIEWYGD